MRMMHYNDYYEVLGIQRDASLSEIKEAYHQRALETHPDKVSGKEDEFKLVNDAYAILSEEQPLSDSCNLHDNPHTLNHYEFNNFLYGVKDRESDRYLTPGFLSAGNKKHIWNQVDYTLGLFQQEKDRLRLLARRHKISKEDEKLLAKLILNEKKLCDLYGVFEGGEKVKFLYDLCLEPDVFSRTDDPRCREMTEIENLIGGLERLREHIRIHPDIDIAGSIFSLKKADLLNRDNFEKLINGINDSFSDITSVIWKLEETESNLLNQTNFDLLVANRQYSLPIRRGMNCLDAEVLTQSIFNNLVNCGKGAETFGSAVRWFIKLNCLNDTNWLMLINIAKGKAYNCLLLERTREIEKNKFLTPEKGELLQWKGEDTFHTLNLRIDKMFAHGVFLLGDDMVDTSKAEAAMQLALELKQKLKIFFETPLEQRPSQQEFNAEFMDLLKSKDDLMGEHRAKWKIIVANVAVGFAATLTAVGLLALGVYYAYSRELLFSKTKRERLRDDVRQEAVQLGMVLTNYN